MIIYNRILLENTYLKEEASRLCASGFISPSQNLAIRESMPSLKTQTSILFRIGLFLLGSLLYSSISWAATYIFSGMFDVFDSHIVSMSFLFAIIGFAVSEFLIREKKYFGYGLEEAFILWGQVSLIAAVYGLMSDDFSRSNIPGLCLLSAIITAVCSLRYLNLVSVFGFFLSVVFLVFYLVSTSGVLGSLFLPFAMMAFSAIIYFISKQVYNKLPHPFYSSGIELISSLSLILFYLSGNYYIVSELANSLVYQLLSERNDIPEVGISLSVLYWMFTFVVPVIYIYFSIKRKDRIMLWIGGLAFAFSCFTFRMYYQVLPLEVVLVAGGLMLFAMALFAMRQLKDREEGLTFKPVRYFDKNVLSDAQALVSTAQFGMKPIEESKPFSGGEGFDGGGSGGTY